MLANESEEIIRIHFKRLYQDIDLPMLQAELSRRISWNTYYGQAGQGGGTTTYPYPPPCPVRGGGIRIR